MAQREAQGGGNEGTKFLSHSEEQGMSDALSPPDTKLSSFLGSLSFQGAQLLLEAVKSLSLPPQHPELRFLRPGEQCPVPRSPWWLFEFQCLY